MKHMYQYISTVGFIGFLPDLELSMKIGFIAMGMFSLYLDIKKKRKK